MTSSKPSVPPGNGIGGSEPTAQVSYVMGYDRERRRRALQASILNPFSEQLLRRAGISIGNAVIGRHILIRLRDPLAILARGDLSCAPLN